MFICRKKSCVHKNFYPKILCKKGQRMFVLKNSSQEKIWDQKNVGPKKFWCEENLRPKRFELKF